MSSANATMNMNQPKEKRVNQNIQVYVRVRPLNPREHEMIEVPSMKEIVARHGIDSKLTKRFTFDRVFGMKSRQVEVYSTVVAPLIEEVLAGYNCTVFAYGQTGTGKTHTMVGTESAELKASWEDNSGIGIIPRALCHLFDELRMMQVEFVMRISYLELYNEELCDLLSSDDNTKIRIFDDSTKKGSVIIQGLEEIPVHSKDDVYKLLEKGKERRKTASTLMNAQSSRSHTVFSILVHIRENGIDGEELVKIGKLNLVDLAGSENSSKAGNEKGIRTREAVNINQSLLTLGRVITALVERTPHIPYRESKLTRLLQESLGGRTKTCIIATVSPGHKDIEESLSTLEYAQRAKNIQNKPEINQKLNKRTVLKEYSDEIDKLKRELIAARDKNGIYLPEETYDEIQLKMESQNKELNEKMLLLKALKEELANKEKMFNEISLNLVDKTEILKQTDEQLHETKKILQFTKRRYKEKKVLLASHIKTEEALYQQAKQLLQIADTATSDTKKLQNTLQRRKDVDHKIESVAQRFYKNMKSNFDGMSQSFKEYKQELHGKTDSLVSHLDNCVLTPQEMMDKQKKEIQILLNASRKKNCELFDLYLQQSDSLSKESKLKVEQLFESLEANEARFKENIKQNLFHVETFSENIKNTLENIQQSIADLLAESLKQVCGFEKNLSLNIEVSKRNLRETIETLKVLSGRIEEEKSLQKREQMCFQEFARSIQEIHERRMSLTSGIAENIEKLLEGNNNMMDSIDIVANGINDFSSAITKSNAMIMSNVNEKIDVQNINIDSSVSKCATIQTQLDNLCELTKKDLEQCRSVQDRSILDAKSVREKYTSSHKANEEEIIKNIVVITEQTTGSIISNEADKLLKQANVCKSITQELTRQMSEYSEKFDDQIQDSLNRLNTFQQSELQTYAPTGQTPSKKEFSYSRTLPMTSPHNKIVRRFRQEHNISDMDSNITIDEENETEGTESESFGTLIVSTPIKRPPRILSERNIEPMQEEPKFYNAANSSAEDINSSNNENKCPC